MNKTLSGFAIFPAIIVLTLIVGIIGLSCAGSNPPFAPFGSTIEILNPPGDFSIPPDTISSITVRAGVQGPDGLPLNDVRVLWDVSFAGPPSLVIDTDGDGLGDKPALQLVDVNACGDIRCDQLTIQEIFEVNPDAFVVSPFETTTDNRGLTEVMVLINGEVIIEPASIEASLQNGDPPAIVTFDVNVP